MKIEHSGEIWKWVVVYIKGKRISYEGYYKVSNYGRIWRIKTLKYETQFGNRTKLIIRNKGEVDFCLKSGYPLVSLSTGTKTKCQFYIHHLVLWAFKGLCPKGMECRHLNDVRTDNRVENLKWGTKRQNSLDAHKNGKHPDRKGEKCPMAFLREKDVKRIRRLHQTGLYLQKELGDKFGISNKHVSEIVLRKIWKHI